MLDTAAPCVFSSRRPEQGQGWRRRTLTELAGPKTVSVKVETTPVKALESARNGLHRRTHVNTLPRFHTLLALPLARPPSCALAWRAIRAARGGPPQGLGQRAPGCGAEGKPWLYPAGALKQNHRGARPGVPGACVRWRGAAAYLRGSGKADERRGRPSAASEGQSAGRTRQRAPVPSLRRSPRPATPRVRGPPTPPSHRPGPGNLYAPRASPAPAYPRGARPAGSALSGQLRLVPGLRSLPELSGDCCVVSGSRVKSRHFREEAKG